MSTRRLKASIDALTEKAEDCADLAKVQRASADKQHESAHKLEVLGDALANDAASLKDEIDKAAADVPAKPALKPAPASR